MKSNCVKVNIKTKVMIKVNVVLTSLQKEKCSPAQFVESQFCDTCKHWLHKKYALELLVVEKG